MMGLSAGFEQVSRGLLISETLVLVLAVFFVLFALGVVWAALWYNTRQEKQVRTDRDEGGQDEDFMLRPGEEEEEEQEGEERLEPGTQRFRRA